MTTATRLRKRTDQNAERLSKGTARHFGVVASLLIVALVGLACIGMMIPESAKPHFQMPSLLRVPN